MIGRLNYILHRAREAGPRALVAKFDQKLRPYVYWPLYAVGHSPQTGASERAALRAFGDLCGQAFTSMAEAGGSAYVERAAERRRRAAAPEWSVLGYGELEKPTGSGWHRDALHDRNFPFKYFPRCDFIAAGKRCDVKIPWEMSRLQWLLWDAEAIATGPSEIRTRRAEAALATLHDWETSNTAGYGVNWTCGMEVAIRGAVLAVICGVLARDLDDAATDRLAALLRAHQKFLARFPEVSDVPGNHYLADLMGEVVLTAALDGLESPRTTHALEVFTSAAEAQFEEGGCHLERATVYHRLALDIFALPYALALRARHASTGTMAGIMSRAAAFMGEITSDAGRLPVFGDQDSGFALWFNEAAQQADIRLCGAPAAPETDLYSFLRALAGTSALFPDVPRQSGVRSGFASVASGAARAVMKTGHQGLKGRAPHDHDDALALSVVLRGSDLIIDPGCHSYTLDPAIRHNQIISSRHNAPVPARGERFLPTQGSINATVRGAGTAELIAHGDGAMSAILPASNASGGIQVIRNVSLTAGRLHIHDTWALEAPDAVHLLWLIHPDWQVSGPAHSADHLTLTLTCVEHTLTAELICLHGGTLGHRVDRYSPDYGGWQDCHALTVTSSAGATGTAELILTWAEG